MSLRTTLVAVTVLAAAGIGAYLWVNRGADGPPPPPAPAELTDPPARKMVELKRLVVLAAPHSGAAWGELGMALDAHDAPAEATTCYRRALDLDPKDARWTYLLAAKVSRGDAAADKEEAVRLYRRATDCSPPSPAHRAAALLTLADLLTELGRGNEAAPLYEKAYDLYPSDPWAAYRMGVLLADRGETREATQILLGLARSPYARKKSAIAMAELTRWAGRAKEADKYEYAASLLPPDHHFANPFTAEVSKLWRGRRALMSRIVAQEAAREDRAAVHTASALADQYPSVESQMMLLRALVNAGDYPAALAVGDDILRDGEGKRMVTAHLFLGLARLGLADRAEAAGRKADTDRLLAQAAESFGETVRLQSNNHPAHFYRAKALLRLGRLPEAEKSARAAVRCRPEEWEGYLVLSDVLAAAGRKAEAITAAEQAVKLAHPNEPRPRQALEALKKKAAVNGP
jgi:tetratricopeptide (TPR) repeat protein